MSFADVFGRRPESSWRSPGRVNLIGEHTDYNGGWVLPFAVPFGVTAQGARRQDREIRVASAQEPGAPVSIGLDDLVPGQTDGWSAYIAGMAWALRNAGVEITGADLLVDGDVPQGAGLSSSHALECAAGSVLADLAGAAPDHGGPAGMTLALVAKDAENNYVGAPTGIMDQSASILCRAGNALLIDCRSLETTQVPLPLEQHGHVIAVINTRAPHQLADGAYAARRAECERAAAILGVPTLREVDAADLAAAEEKVLAAIEDGQGDVVRRRMRHVVTENDRVLRVAALLRDLRLREIGPVLDTSHTSMRDDFEISCPELDSAVEAARSAGALGARMTGGGFGGSAIALVPVDLVDDVRRAALAFAADRGLAQPEVFTVHPVDGLARV